MYNMYFFASVLKEIISGTILNLMFSFPMYLLEDSCPPVGSRGKTLQITERLVVKLFFGLIITSCYHHQLCYLTAFKPRAHFEVTVVDNSLLFKLYLDHILL